MNNLNILSTVQTEQSVMPNLVNESPDEFETAINSDFIRHPEQYPLQIKKLRRWPWGAKAADFSGAKHGLSIHTERYVPAGSQLEISIPLRGATQAFVATVVLVRELASGFELGVWFENQADEERAKIVEKICETECGLGNISRNTKSASSAKHELRDWLQFVAKPLLGH